MIGILTTLMLTTPTSIGNEWQQKVKEWQSEQDRTPIEEVLNSSLDDYWEDQENGSDDTPVTEELLQLPSDGNKESS